MAKKLYDIAVKVGTFEDRQGKEKGDWRNVGVILEGTKGPYMLMDRTFNPAGISVEQGESNVLLSLFKPQSRGSQQ